MSNKTPAENLRAKPVSARKAATSTRISSVANELFFAQGFNVVTMEEIAKAAGIRRSTLYLHFRDKGEILTDIAADYIEKLRPVIARLPAPSPTADEIEAWVAEFAEFVSSERASTELLVSLSHLPDAHPATKTFGRELQLMMAERVTAFKKALEPGNTLALAWSLATLDALGWALCHHARENGSDLSRQRLVVACATLNRFVRGEL